MEEMDRDLKECNDAHKKALEEIALKKKKVEKRKKPKAK